MNIRLIKQKDSYPLFRLIEENRDRLLPYFPITIKEVVDLKSAKRYVNLKIDQSYHKELYYFLFFDENENPIGNVSAKNFDWEVPKCELSYFIGLKYEGKGYISKALDFLIDYCFDTLGMEKLFLRVASMNSRSIQIALKKNFELEGVHKRDFRTGKGELVDVAYYALLKNDFMSFKKLDLEKSFK